jgi:molybdenum cofactor cytidylyltransferase
MILAAGASRRLGRPKQLLDYNGEMLLERAERLAVSAGASPVVTVLGAHFVSISAAFHQRGAIRIFNQQWEQGISSSIQAGLNSIDAFAPDAPGVLIMTCDQPRITADHLTALIDAFQSAQDSIASSFYAGSCGVPAVFPRSLFPELNALRGDKGAKSLLVAPPRPVISIPFAEGEVDIDLPADLAQLE